MAAPKAINRNSCLLHGALQTVRAIEGAVPIIHSTPGCGAQQYWGGSSLSGCSGTQNTGGFGTPSTNVIERQVVFGGTSRLREQLKNTVKIKKGNFYVVLTGCAAELVGDDVPAMTKELQEQQHKAIHISTPGFKGSVHQGYAVAVKGILQQLEVIGSGEESPKAKPINPKLVNLFGIIPEQDVFWQSHLETLKETLEAVGAEVNVLLGYGSGVDQWSRVPAAALNISLTVHGNEIAEWLEEQFGTPYISWNGFPVGAGQTAELLRTVSDRLGFREEALREWTAQAERKEACAIGQILDTYYRFQFQRKFAIVGDSGSIIGIARYLTNPLGLLPSKLIITDHLNREQQSAILKELNEALDTEGLDIRFEGDGKHIEELVLSSDVELVLGSTIEEAAARRKGLPFVPVAFPIANRVVLNRGYAGTNGALTLLEELGNALIRNLEEKQVVAGNPYTVLRLQPGYEEAEAPEGREEAFVWGR